MPEFKTSSPIARAFQDWLNQGIGVGQGAEFDTFLRDHPLELHAELRSMVDDYIVLQDAVGPEGQAFHSGRVFGDYCLIRELGRGGMGVVWEAEQISLKRRVALKLLQPQLSLSSTSLDRFQREAKAGGRLQHASLVQTYGTGETDGVHWIAQELVPGGFTLADELAQQRQQLELPDDWYGLTAKRFVKLADALGFAHEADVLHRDVKPGNILLGEDGDLKVADFGLAYIQDDLDVSRDEGFLGTPYYSSPEQAEPREGGLDHRSDIFSLGSTLYEVLTLVRAFDGDTTGQIARKIVDEDPLAPQVLRSRVPSDLAVICGKCLEKNPAQRYQSMAELAEDLRRHLCNEPILAKPPSTWTRFSKWCNRHPGRSVAAAALLISLPVISGLGTWIVSNIDDVKAQKYAALVDAANEMTRDGFHFMDEGDDAGRALEFFNEALGTHPGISPHAVAGLALATAKLEGPEKGIRILHSRQKELAAFPELVRVEVAILQIARLDEDAANVLNELSPPTTGIGWSLEGRRWMAVAGRSHGEAQEQGFTEANAAFHQAIFLSKEASLHDYAEFAHSLTHLDDPRPKSELAIAGLRALWPDHPVATYWRANALAAAAQKNGNKSEDIEYFLSVYEEAVKLGIDETPYALPAHVNMADSLRRVGRTAEAEPHYRKAVEASPTSSRARGELGSTLYSLGQIEEGLAELKKAVDGHPTDGYARTHLGSLYIEQNRLEEAEFELRATLETGFDYALTHYHLAIVLKKTERSDEAVDEFRLAIKGGMNSFVYQFNLAHFLDSLNRLEAAEEEYRKAIQMNSKHPQAHCNLGFVLKKLERPKEALAEFRIGHELGIQQEDWNFPSAEWLAEAEKAAAD